MLSISKPFDSKRLCIMYDCRQTKSSGMVRACWPFCACHGALTSTLTPLGLQAQECVFCPAARPRHSLKAAFWTCCPGVYQVACVQPFQSNAAHDAHSAVHYFLGFIRDMLSISCAVGAFTFQHDLEITYSRLTYISLSGGHASAEYHEEYQRHCTIQSCPIREGYRNYQYLCCKI